MNSGKWRRLARLSRPGDGRHLFVPMDHSVSEGPVELTCRFPEIAVQVAAAGADAVIVHKGRAAALVGRPMAGACGLVVHLSASTVHGPDPDAKVLVGSVEDAVRLGADAVSVHVNVGAPTERDQLAALGSVATGCERYGMPLLAMMYVRGPNVIDPYDADVLAHAVNIALDLGADIVKTAMPRPLHRIDKIVTGCSGRVIFSGGGFDQSAGIVEMARIVLDAGAAGLAVGRRVWTEPDPGSVVRDLVAVVHPRGDQNVLPLAGSLTGEAV